MAVRRGVTDHIHEPGCNILELLTQRTATTVKMKQDGDVAGGHAVNGRSSYPSALASNAEFRGPRGKSQLSLSFQV